MSLDSDLHKKFSKEECRNNVIQLFGGFTSFDNFSKSLDQSVNEIPELSISSENPQFGGGDSDDNDLSMYNIQNGGFDDSDDDEQDGGGFNSSEDQYGGSDPYYKKYQKYKSKYLEFKNRLNL